jgi:hypothetical protein
MFVNLFLNIFNFFSGLNDVSNIDGIFNIMGNKIPIDPIERRRYKAEYQKKYNEMRKIERFGGGIPCRAVNQKHLCFRQVYGHFIVYFP